MKIAYLCLSSSNNAIAQGFNDIVHFSSTNKDIYFIGTSYSIPCSKLIKSERHLLIRYAKNIRAILDLMLAMFQIRSFLKEKRINHLFIYSPIFINGLISFAIPRNIKISLWLHDPILHSGEKKWVKFAKFFDEFILLASNQLNNVFVASNYLKQVTLKTHFSKKNIKIIPFPYLTNLASSLSDSQPFISKQNGTIVFFGRIEKYKGLELLCDLLLKNPKIFDHIKKITIAGQGVITENIRKLSESNTSVTLINQFLPDNDLKKLIIDSEIAIFPYIDATATQALQTAGALGCKILSSDAGSLPEFVQPIGSRIFSWEKKGDFIEKLLELLDEKTDPVIISNTYRSEFSPSKFNTLLLKSIE